jgi:hypothetical protein
MTDEQTPMGDAILEDRNFARLAEHLSQCREGVTDIIPDAREPHGPFIVSILEIGQVNIDDTLELSEHAGILVTPTVVNHGDVKTPLYRKCQTLQDPGKVWCGGDEFDVVAPLFLKLDDDTGQGFTAARPAGNAMADLVVLTVDAFQITGGEKKRPRPTAAGDGRLFPVVGKSV